MNGSILYFVDVDIDSTKIHRIDLNTGKYIPLRKVTGNFSEQSIHVIHSMLQDNPSKIVFDNMGYGKGLSDAFKWIVQHPSFGINIDMNGNVRYENA